MPEPAARAEPRPRSLRDPRIDLFRGAALIMIFIDHIPGNLYEHFTLRNFGLSDAAEAFVFMSGVAAALAYGPGLARGINWPGVSRIWGRAWLLYMVHILTAVWAIAIVSAAVQFWGADEMLTRNAFKPLRDDPYAFLVGIATLGHQIGYVNILPMYAVLLLMAPALIRLGQRWPLGLLGGSLAFWAVTGLFRLDLPNYPFKGGWFFNPLAWQLLFSIGILTGLALRQGRRFVPVRLWLAVLAGGWLAFNVVWVHSETLQAGIGHLSWIAQNNGVPFIFAGFDKTYVSAPRLLHFLALAYVLSLPGLIPAVARAPALEPVRLLGRQALPVFAMGTVLAIAGQAIKEIHPGGLTQDSALIAGGLAIQFALAWARDRFGPKALARRAQAEAAPGSPDQPTGRRDGTRPRPTDPSRPAAR